MTTDLREKEKINDVCEKADIRAVTEALNNNEKYKTAEENLYKAKASLEKEVLGIDHENTGPDRNE